MMNVKKEIMSQLTALMRDALKGNNEIKTTRFNTLSVLLYCEVLKEMEEENEKLKVA